MAPAVLEVIYTLVTVCLVSWFVYKSLNGVRRPVLFWFLFGFTFNLFSLSWLYTTYPLSWLPAGPSQLAMIAVVHILASLFGGIGIALVGYAFTFTKKPQVRAFLFPALLAGGEVLRSLLFSLLFLGSGATIGLHFSAGTTGNALSTTPLVEYAYFGGVYMLTFVLGLLIIAVMNRKNMRYWWTVPAGVMVVYFLIHSLVPIHTPENTVRVASITTNFTNTATEENFSDEFSSRFAKLHSMTTPLADEGVDIITYPEDARYISYMSQDKVNELKKNFPDTLFIDGDTRRSGSGFSNISLFYTAKKPTTALGRAKIFLFPFSEYIPQFFKPFSSIFVRETDLEEYKRTRSYVSASSMETIDHEGLTIGTLICSEILSYTTIQKLKEEQPDIVIFQSYLNSFHGSPLLSMNFRSLSKIAAAQMRTPILTSTNNGEAYVVSPYGSIVSSAPIGFDVSTVTFHEENLTIEK